MKLNWKKIVFLFALTSFIGISQAKEKKTVFIIVDGIPADVIDRLHVPVVFDIAKNGTYGYSFVGGTVGEYTQTPTISAVGYNTMLTGTWVNKHNVYGNDNLSPNYNYWSFFRIAKEQKRKVTTAIFSGWTDNRTVLLGYGKPETNNLKIDYVYDGYDLDSISFPHKPKELQVFDYDEKVSISAAECIKKNAPDLSWVYLWYPDDASHIAGNGKYFDEYILKAGKQVERIWNSVKYREQHFDEDWLVILTTDHGRTNDGYSHGGQSERERKTWVSMNKLANKRFKEGRCAAVDINPTICRFMNFDLPPNVKWEQDGISMLGDIEMEQLRVEPYDNQLTLRWKCLLPNATATVYIAPSNKYRESGNETWTKIGIVNLKEEHLTINLNNFPKSVFYKFVLVSDHSSLNCWYNKKQ